MASAETWSRQRQRKTLGFLEFIRCDTIQISVLSQLELALLPSLVAGVITRSNSVWTITINVGNLSGVLQLLCRLLDDKIDSTVVICPPRNSLFLCSDLLCAINPAP